MQRYNQLCHLAPSENEEHCCQSRNESQESVDEGQCEADDQDDGNEEPGDEENVVGQPRQQEVARAPADPVHWNLKQHCIRDRTGGGTVA